MAKIHILTYLSNLKIQQSFKKYRQTVLFKKLFSVRFSITNLISYAVSIPSSYIYQPANRMINICKIISRLEKILNNSGAYHLNFIIKTYIITCINIWHLQSIINICSISPHFCLDLR